MFLVVHGPAPSCDVAGVIPLRGRRGENVVRFSGRIDGRLIPRGIYRLTVSPTRAPAAGGEAEAVRVVSARRTVAVPDSAAKLSCTAAHARGDSVVDHDPRRQEPGRRAESTAPEVRPKVPLRPPLLRAMPELGVPEHGGGGGGGLVGLVGFWAFVGIGLASAGLVGLLALGVAAALRARRGF